MDYVLIPQPEFGKRLHRLRVERKLSQKALAAESMTPSYISLLEHGRRIPTLDVVLRLAKLLDVPPQELIGEDLGRLTSSLSTGAASSSSAVADSVEIRSLTETGDLEAACAALRARLDAQREQGDTDGVLTTGIELLGLLAKAGRQDERLELLDELAALPAVQHSDAVRLSLLVDRASALREAGRLPDARDAAHEATRLLGGSASPPTPERVRALGVLASVLSELNEFEAAESVVADMLALAKVSGHQGTLGRAQWVASMAYNGMGRHAEAFEHLKQARTTLAYEGMSVRDWLRFCRFNATILLDGGQDPAAALEWIQAAEATAGMSKMHAEQVTTKRFRARYELSTGSLDSALRLYTELLDEPIGGNERLATLLGLSEALERSGRHDEAVRWLREAASNSEENGNYRKATEIWRHIDELRQQPAKKTGAPSGRRKASRR